MIIHFNVFVYRSQNGHIVNDFTKSLHLHAATRVCSRVFTTLIYGAPLADTSIKSKRHEQQKSLLLRLFVILCVSVRECLRPFNQCFKSIQTFFKYFTCIFNWCFFVHIDTCFLQHFDRIIRTSGFQEFIDILINSWLSLF